MKSQAVLLLAALGGNACKKKKHLTGGKSEVPSKGREEKMHESRRAL